jgi:hypothetical protein
MLLNNTSPVDFDWHSPVVQAGFGQMAERDRLICHLTLQYRSPDLIHQLTMDGATLQFALLFVQYDTEGQTRHNHAGVQLKGYLLFDWDHFAKDTLGGIYNLQAVFLSAHCRWNWPPSLLILTR